MNEQVFVSIHCRIEAAQRLEAKQSHPSVGLRRGLATGWL